MSGDRADEGVAGLFREMADADGLAAFIAGATDAGAESLIKFCCSNACAWEAPITDASVRCPRCAGPIATKRVAP